MTDAAENRKRMEDLQDLHRAYRRVFLRRGAAKKVLEDLEQRTHLNGTTFYPDMVNPAEALIFQEGRRSIGLHIRFMLDPDNFTDEALQRITGGYEYGGK